MLELGVTPQPLTQFGEQSPKLIYARSHTAESYGQYLADLLNGLPELRERSDRYLPLADGRANIERTAIETVAATDPEQRVEIPAAEPPKQKIVAEDRYELKGRYGMAHLVMDRETFSLIRIEAVNQD